MPRLPLLIAFLISTPALGQWWGGDPRVSVRRLDRPQNNDGSCLSSSGEVCLIRRSGNGTAAIIWRALNDPALYNASIRTLIASDEQTMTSFASGARVCPDDGHVLTQADAPAHKPCIYNVDDEVWLRVRSNPPSSLSSTLDNMSVHTANNWLLIGTPAISANVWDYGRGLTGERIEDTDGAISEGLERVFTTSARYAVRFSCYLGADTLTVARLAVYVAGSEVNTCAVALGASPTRAFCHGIAPVLSGSSDYQFKVLPGANDAATGSIFAGGCSIHYGSTGSIAATYPGEFDLALSPTMANERFQFANPLQFVSTKWCASVKVKWYADDPIGGLGSQAFWSMGSLFNRVFFGMKGAGQISFETTSPTGLNRSHSSAMGLITTPGPHVLRACYANDDAPEVWLNGAPVELTSGGGFGEAEEFPPEINLGGMGASFQLNGLISDLCVTDNEAECEGRP